MNDSYLRLIALAAIQHGGFNREQALECGVTSTMLNRRVENGSLVRPYPGTYLLAGSAATWERAVSVAVLSAGPSAAASHATACHLHGVALRPRRIEVSVATGGIRTRDFVIHRSTDLIQAEVETVNGIRTTNLARTLVDVGIPWGEGFAGRCLSEGVRRQLVTDIEVARILHRVARKGRNGVGPIREVLVERLGGVEIGEGVMEDQFLRIMKAAGVDLPQPQVHVSRYGGGFIARVDFVYHQVKLVIELDGFAFHSDPKAFRHDRRQQNALVVQGYRVLRFTYFDLFAAPEYVVSQVVGALARVA